MKDTSLANHPDSAVFNERVLSAKPSVIFAAFENPF